MTASKEIFETALNPVFIETGSCAGDGIQQALDAGYREVHSIEVDPKFHETCKKRFSRNNSVNLYQGSSIIWLPKILKTMQERCTFWLDSHYFDPYNPQSMVIEELLIIGLHFRKNHTILIDDMRLMEVEFKIKRQTLKNMLKLINPEYKIETVDGGGAGLKNDILQARAI